VVDALQPRTDSEATLRAAGLAHEPSVAERFSKDFGSG
jgi:hypothetical protein